MGLYRTLKELSPTNGPMAQTVNMQPRMSRQAVPQAITKLSFTFHHRVGKGFFSDDFTIGLAQSKLRQSGTTPV